MTVTVKENYSIFKMNVSSCINSGPRVHQKGQIWSQCFEKRVRGSALSRANAK